MANVAADAAFGSDEKARKKWFKAKRRILRRDPKGVDKVIDALRYLLRKGRGSEEIRRVLGYFRNNHRRMNYYHVAEEGYPIGSGEAEAANKMLVTHRLKRSGQRWGRDGSQGVLAFRALLKSDRLDRAWAMAVPRMKRSKKTGIRPKRQQMIIGRSSMLRDSRIASTLAKVSIGDKCATKKSAHMEITLNVLCWQRAPKLLVQGTVESPSRGRRSVK